MPSTKISTLTVLSDPAAGDLIPIVDISDTTMAASGTTKRVTQSVLAASFSPNWAAPGTIGSTTPNTGAFTSLSATGITTVASGTALLPSIVSTTGTADTGLWFPAADTLAASTAGSERIRISSTGNVGIGTTSPAAVLHINSTVAGAGIRLSQSNSVNHYTRLRESGQDGFGGAFLDAYYDGYQVLAFSFDPALNKPSIIYGSRFQNTSKNLTISIRGGADVMTFNNAGYVGIGTTSPGAQFAVQVSETASYKRLANFYNTSATGISYITVSKQEGEAVDTAAVFAYSAADNLGWLGIAGDGLGTGLHFKRGGNVGIGTTSPTSKLHVVGDSNLGGFTISSAGVVTAGTVPADRVTGLTNLEAIYNSMLN